MTCGPAYSQEREEKEKARARLDWEEMEQRDEVGSRDTRSRLDSEGNFIDDVFFLASAMAGGG